MNSTAELDPRTAYNLALLCVGMVDFPSRKHTIENVALDLGRMCKGAFWRGNYWQPEQQARWLMNAARDTWPKWQGPYALRQLFASRFPLPEDLPPLPPKPGPESKGGPDQSTLF